MDKETAELLKGALEVVNKVEDPELHSMIEKFDYTPAPELTLNINEYLNIYNWLKELELYRKICGPL